MERFWYLLATLIGLVVVFGLSVWQFDSAEDVATASGPVVAAMATIGAAIFGIAIGRETGKSEGREQGRESGRKEVAAESLTYLAGQRQESGRPAPAGGAPSGPVADVGRTPGTERLDPLEARLRSILDS